jgi:UDPglucose--hexose-1-phosphate uridylyltransferase
MKAIHTLIDYGLFYKLISKEDINYINNKLSYLLKIEPNMYIYSKYNLKSINKTIDKIFNFAVKQNIVENNVIAKNNFKSMVLDIFTPKPSVLNDNFNKLLAKNHSLATDYLHNIMILNNYINKDQTAKNINFNYISDYGKLEITINVSKPEKSNKEIIDSLNNTQKINYPKCALCQENVGYYNNGRSNYRAVPLTLNNEPFYFYYSPYVYYQEHSVVSSKEHTPMAISKKTFSRLFDFVDLFPTYFLGSNGGLPIVGGSILNHEHYQGGKYNFPIEQAKSFKEYKINNITASLLNWPISTIRLKSKDRKSLIDMADIIRTKFEKYENLEADIIPFSKKIRHNTIAPILRKKKKMYQLDIILRNNKTSEEHPDGIFHTHKEIHDIKKEGIGLIEAIGLAILPSRLATDLPLIEKYIKGKIKTFPRIELYPNLINRVKNKNLINQELIRKEVAVMFKEGLENCGIFKQNNTGKEQFKKFFEGILNTI